MDGQSALVKMRPSGWTVLLACLAAAAIGMHVPGQLSMDSSLQVYEALTGHSVSWAPPFMSALLRWLGGGWQATASFVILCSLATYGGFALALSRRTEGVAWSRYRVLRIAAIAVLVCNPVVFLYVGIVWKDVLFAAQLALVFGLMFAACVPGRNPRIPLLLALLVLLPAPLVRQHGVLVAPILAVPCLWALSAVDGPWLRRWVRFCALGLAWVLLFLALDGVVHRTIRDSGDKSSAVGLTAIARYDLSGMIAGGFPLAELPPSLRAPEFVDAVHRTYSPDRIDFVLDEPNVLQGFQDLEPSRLYSIWARAVASRPGLYAAVKLDQYAWLLDLHRLDRCLPVHVGIEGNRDYLAATGFEPGVGARPRALYALSMFTRYFALYRHWFYLAVFACCVAAVAGKRRSLSGLERNVLVAAVVATAVLYASFLPTVLACDFRYLYPCITMVSALALYLLTHASTDRPFAEKTR